METTLRHLDITAKGSRVWKAIRLLSGQMGPFWWDDSIRAGISIGGGLFPASNEMMHLFGSRMIVECQEIDILGGWLAGEKRLHTAYFPQAKCVPLSDLAPFFFKNPWTRALAKKAVLVVHPFDKTIRQQYQKRSALFRNPLVLPEFDLVTYKAVQSLGGNKTRFLNWHEALEHMCHEISQLSFDIAVIGAGAYGMPLAAHIKRMGKKAVHMGGATQLLFGIKGRRWDSRPEYSQILYNEQWTRPLACDCPDFYSAVEDGCYS